MKEMSSGLISSSFKKPQRRLREELSSFPEYTENFSDMKRFSWRLSQSIFEIVFQRKVMQRNNDRPIASRFQITVNYPEWTNKTQEF